MRSIKLDRWKKNHLKSIEISGNKYAKDKFIELGIPKESGIYDYHNGLVQTYKLELQEIVKNILMANMQTNDNSERNNETNNNNNNSNTNTNSIKNPEDVNFDDIPVNKVDKPVEPEYKEPTKFNFTESVDVKVVPSSNGTSTGKSKRNNQKIQKVDFDFNFDNFNDVDFSSFNNVSGEDNQQSNQSNGTAKKKNGTGANFDEEFSSSKNMRNNYDDEDNYRKPKISKEEINKKFANKKAISSEDYANLEEDPSEMNAHKYKLNSMKNSQAISSSDIYGGGDDDYDGKF